MHIVFQQEDINTLSRSFDLDDSLRAKIILIKDDYAVGPLKDIYSPEGIEERKNWWKNVLSGSDFSELINEVDDNKTAEELKEILRNGSPCMKFILFSSGSHTKCK